MGLKTIGPSNLDSGFENTFKGQSTYDSAGASVGPNAPIPDVPGGHTATGGVIKDYATPTGTNYRCHVFRSPGNFVVSSLSALYPAHIEYLVVAGGGGGAGGAHSGGGGGGGYRTNVPGDPHASPNTNNPITTATYAVTVGGGGAAPGAQGNDSVFANPSAPITSEGGGAGGTPTGGGSGGSGGGGG